MKTTDYKPIKPVARSVGRKVDTSHDASIQRLPEANPSRRAETGTRASRTIGPAYPPAAIAANGGKGVQIFEEDSQGDLQPTLSSWDEPGTGFEVTVNGAIQPETATFVRSDYFSLESGRDLVLK